MVEAEGRPGRLRLALGGPAVILVGTAIGGGSGYILTVLAGATLGAAGYAPFAVFWSSLYLVITALTGVQQEMSRASGPRGTDTPRPVARNFALFGSAAVAVLALVSSPLWAPLVFPDDGWALVFPLAFGIGSYVITAVTGGVVFGLRLWTIIGVMVSVDGLLRLVITGVALLFTRDTEVLAWAIVLPFLLTPLALWVFMRHRLVGRFELDVGYRRLLGNVLRTLPGSAATGVLISGFPVLLGATSPSTPAAALAALLFSINLARAPLVIITLSLQSYFLVMFQRTTALVRTLTLLLVATGGGAVVLGGIAWWVGPTLLDMFGKEFVVEGFVLGVIVASGGLVGMLCITGSAVLARSRHSLYSGGWLVAAASVILVLLSPLDFTARAMLSLVIGPILGLVVHLGGLVLTRSVVEPARAL